MSPPEHDTHDSDMDIKDADADAKATELAVSSLPISSLPISSLPIDGKDEPIVTRRELWSYYLYYNGDNGVGPLGYSMTLFQSWATAAGYDPSAGPGTPCTAGPCVVPWGSGTRSVSSVVLVANGLSFAVMTLIFTTIGSAADYGTFGRWLLLAVTVVCWAAQFASMALTSASRWRTAMALYMLGFISYGATLVFYAALFPRLARNTARSRTLREQYDRGEVSREDYEREESLEKNRVSNISTVRVHLWRDAWAAADWGGVAKTHSNIGYVVTLCLNLSILLPLASNPKVNNYTIVLTNGYWVLTGIWWFIFQQPRPGPPLPKGEHYITIGWKQIALALRQYRRLPYTFVYLFAYFLLADGLNTTGTLISLCQNTKFSFSFLQNTYLGLAQAVTSTAATLGFWYVQRWGGVRTKRMFVVTNVVTILIPLWGMVGMWTDKIGCVSSSSSPPFLLSFPTPLHPLTPPRFHNAWEFWFYNVIFGLFQAPYYAFAQTMMAELTPPGFDNM
ncbi:hypothetical protein NEOLEDRAFT_1175178, partial [Neolentinus lepideus HHB14362 ss-1]